jgi:hypothetical protein
LNNPIRYTDPTGHRPIIDEDENGNPIVDTDWRPGGGNGRGGTETDTNGNGIPDVPDPTWSIPTGMSGYPTTCEYDSIVECLYAGKLLPSGDISISNDEWNKFTLALFLDIFKRSIEGDGFWTADFNPMGKNIKYFLIDPFVPFHTSGYHDRKWYDTPFFNGDPNGENLYTGNVCFENGKCHDRNDVNYIAQGMWSAAAHEGQLGALIAVNAWKYTEYEHSASPSVMYWTMQGVLTYQQYTWP